jgi:membrane-associated phospholipid phosphatase
MQPVHAHTGPAGTPAPAAAPRRRAHAGLYELGIFALAYLTYFGVRALTEGHAPEALRNAGRLIDFERDVGLLREHAVQSAFTGSGTLTDIANNAYIYGHWPVLIVAGVLLFNLRREHYRVLRNACLISGLVGLLIFALFPVAPPRLTDLPVVDTVTQGSPGYRQVVPPSLVNQYAAMPSFHAGWNLLVGIVVFRATHNVVLRAFAVLMPAVMAVAVVATANHFVVDVVAGVAIVLAALALALWLERRRARPTLDRDRPTPDIEGPSEPYAVPHRPSSRERPRTPALR